MADTDQTDDKMADIVLKSQQAENLRRAARAARGRGLVAELDCRPNDAIRHNERAVALFKAAEEVDG